MIRKLGLIALFSVIAVFSLGLRNPGNDVCNHGVKGVTLEVSGLIATGTGYPPDGPVGYSIVTGETCFAGMSIYFAGTADSEGNIRFTLPQQTPGNYTLRAYQLRSPKWRLLAERSFEVTS